jgi:hypothetical protein
MATSLALKCSGSKTLLDNLEKAFEKLELEADESLSKIRDVDVPVVSNGPAASDGVNSIISFRVPPVVKGAKTKRASNVVEKKKKEKKKRSSEKQGTACTVFLNHHLMFLIVAKIFQEKDQVTLKICQRQTLPQLC